MTRGQAAVLAAFAVAYIVGAWIYPWPWSLLSRSKEKP